MDETKVAKLGGDRNPQGEWIVWAATGRVSGPCTLPADLLGVFLACPVLGFEGGPGGNMAGLTHEAQATVTHAERGTGAAPKARP